MYHKAKLENFLTSLVIITQNYAFYIISYHLSGFSNPLSVKRGWVYGFNFQKYFKDEISPCCQ